MPVNSNDIIQKFVKTLRSGKGMTDEHIEYFLIKELYHCTPTQFEEIEERKIKLHLEMIYEEKRREHIQNERAKQRATSNHNKQH